MRPLAKKIALASGAALFVFGAIVILPTVRTRLSTKVAEPVAAGTRPTVRLISKDQYTNSIHDFFGPDIKIPARFAPVQRKQGLVALGAATAVVTPGSSDQFESVAEAIASQVVDEEHRSTLVSCVPASDSAPDIDCARKFVVKVGRLLYRRPLTESEVAQQVALAGKTAQITGSFYSGLSYSLVSMMTSPKFLYISENYGLDSDNADGHQLTNYSKASRLSLFLWDALPDEQLLKAAEAGKLDTAQGLADQVDRMLRSPRLEAGMRNFFSDMLAFDAFDNLAKDPIIYPAFTRTMAEDAKEQVLRTILDHLLTRNADYRDLFTTRRTFMNGTLGMIYQVPVEQPQNWQPYEFPVDSHRSGLLTEIGFLSLYGHPGRSSPTRRGRGLRERFLCQNVPDPPPNVNFSIIEDRDHHYKTARERLEAHRSDPVCAGCHRITDPMGLALENFDGAGQYRTQENGAQIDTSGQLDGVKFENAVELGKAMHDNAAVNACLVNRLYAYGIGRETAKADGPYLVYLQKRFGEYGYQLPALLRLIAESPSFFAVPPHSSEIPPTRDAASAKDQPQEVKS